MYIYIYVYIYTYKYLCLYLYLYLYLHLYLYLYMCIYVHMYKNRWEVFKNSWGQLYLWNTHKHTHGDSFPKHAWTIVTLKTCISVLLSPWWIYDMYQQSHNFKAHFPQIPRAGRLVGLSGGLLWLDKTACDLSGTHTNKTIAKVDNVVVTDDGSNQMKIE